MPILIPIEQCERYFNAKKRFEYNILRVRNLVDIYETLPKHDIQQQDVLRAAVVMLHATLEDALRCLLEWKLPKFDKKELANIHIRSFNNSGEVRRALSQLGIKNGNAWESVGKLTPLMKRRHKIVHQSDRERLGDKDHGKPTPMLESAVETWIDTAEAFICEVFGTVIGKPGLFIEQKRLMAASKITTSIRSDSDQSGRAVKRKR